MRKNIIHVALFAGALALAPTMARAFTGILVQCDPTDGVAIPVTLSPGLDCNDSVNKIAVAASMDGCSANASAPWGAWSTAKYPTKITQAAATALTAGSIALKVKAKTYGSCNFSGSTTSARGSGAAKYTILDNTGAVKVGKGAAFGTVGGDLASQSAKLDGLITKGDITGAELSILIGIDISSPNNANILACNLGAVCPPPIPPATTLDGKTTPTTHLWIGFPDNASCTGLNLPWVCCTGAAAGNC
jgi:hypothetical protein